MFGCFYMVEAEMGTISAEATIGMSCQPHFNLTPLRHTRPKIHKGLTDDTEATYRNQSMPI